LIQILFHRAFGFASWELRTPNTLTTRFGIASITKPLTETLVDVLVKDGRLDLDAAVETYIPDFPKGPEGAHRFTAIRISTKKKAIPGPFRSLLKTNRETMG